MVVVGCSPDGAKRNPGSAEAAPRSVPHSAALHAGYGLLRRVCIDGPVFDLQEAVGW